MASITTVVIRGEYSNDSQRHALLDNRYGEVVAMVNDWLIGNFSGTTEAARMRCISPTPRCCLWQKLACVARINGI